MRLLPLLACALALGACTPSNGNPDASPPAPVPAPQPAPAPGPAALGAVTAACNNLKLLRCPEGVDPMCWSTLGRVVALDAGFADPNFPCLASASSAAAARACSPGFITCVAPASRSH
jgi:hypothetical protein